MTDGSAKIRNFFQDNKSPENTERKNTTARIKSRNFLSNMSYAVINKEDFYNRNFIFNVYLLVTKNLNPFSLNRKLNDKNKHEIIYMLWSACQIDFISTSAKRKSFFTSTGKTCYSQKYLK